MSEITDFTATVNAQFDRIGTGLDGIQSDVTQLKAEIEALKASGTISAEDRAALDGLSARATAIGNRVADLDAETTPPPPPEA